MFRPSLGPERDILGRGAGAFRPKFRIDRSRFRFARSERLGYLNLLPENNGELLASCSGGPPPSPRGSGALLRPKTTENVRRRIPSTLRAQALKHE